MFLEISQNSQENTCARVSFLTPFFQNTSGWLLPCFLNKWFHMFLWFRFRLQLECKIYRISPEAYSEHSWTSKMKLSAKIVKDLNPWTILSKKLCLQINGLVSMWQGPLSWKTWISSAEAYSEPCQQTCKMQPFAIANNKRLKTVHYFCKTLHLRCLTRLQMHASRPHLFKMVNMRLSWKYKILFCIKTLIAISKHYFFNSW